MYHNFLILALSHSDLGYTEEYEVFGQGSGRGGGDGCEGCYGSGEAKGHGDETGIGDGHGLGYNRHDFVTTVDYALLKNVSTQAVADIKPANRLTHTTLSGGIFILIAIMASFFSAFVVTCTGLLIAVLKSIY